MTISQFESNQINQFAYNTPNYLKNNLWYRYINSSMSYNVLYKGKRQFQQSPIIENPLEGIDNYENQVIVFLSRGVDPYSSRVMTKYGLGRLFGYVNEDTIQVTGMTKLNIPIQSGFKNTRHNQIVNSDGVDTTYSNKGLYYNTYYYEPIQFSSFTGNNHTYYSSLQTNVSPTYGSACPSNDFCGSNFYANSP